MLTTMVLVDVTKLMVGRLRPVFLEVCQLNTTLCFSDDQRCNVDRACMQADGELLRWARYAAVRTHHQFYICEILTGERGGRFRVWNAHSPDRERYSMPVGGGGVAAY